METEPTDLHDYLNTVDKPLNQLADADLCPGVEALMPFQRVTSLAPRHSYLKQSRTRSLAKPTFGSTFCAKHRCGARLMGHTPAVLIANQIRTYW